MSKATDQLRLRREKAGLTLDQIQQRTNIRADYLRAVEGGEFSALPGKFYARAFIKAYSEYLGVDPAPILRQFEAGVKPAAASAALVPAQAAAAEPVTRLSRKERLNRERNTRKSGSWMAALRSINLPKKRILFPLLGLVLLIPAAIVFFSLSGEEAAKPPDDPSRAQAQTPSRPVSGDESVVQLVKPSETYGYGDLFEISKAGEVTVTLEAKEKTWYRYRAGGPTKKVSKEASLGAGKKETFRHASWVSLMVGNPDRVDLTVNGHVIDTSSESEAHAYQLKRKR